MYTSKLLCYSYFVIYEVLPIANIVGVVNKVIVYSFHELVHVVTLLNWAIDIFILVYLWQHTIIYSSQQIEFYWRHYNLEK